MTKVLAESIRIFAVLAMLSVGACGAKHRTSSSDLPTPSEPTPDQPCSPPTLTGEAAIQTIAEAERLLAVGKLGDAHRLVQTHQFLDRDLQLRSLIVECSAVFRSEYANPSKRVPIIRSCVSWLEIELTQNENNPLLVARLAEGYALNSKTRAKAKKLLEDLAKRDLMPDAFGYATFAQLLAGSGEDTAAKEAIGLCKQTAKRRSICTPLVLCTPLVDTSW